MMRAINTDRQQTMMTKWCIIVVVAVMEAYESSVCCCGKNDLNLAPCLAVKTGAASHSHSHMLLMLRAEAVLITG